MWYYWEEGETDDDETNEIWKNEKTVKLKVNTYTIHWTHYLLQTLCETLSWE